MCGKGALLGDVIARVREVGFAEVEVATIPPPVDGWLDAVTDAAAATGIQVAFLRAGTLIEIVDIEH